MAKPEIINFDNINYAIYKVGTWKNHYEINQIGLSREIPVTNATLHHVKLSMEEIRKSEFDIDNKTVNGFVAIALQLNPKIQKMDLDDVIALEQKEYESILEELDNLELLSDDGSVSLDTEDYLIFKLEKASNVTFLSLFNSFGGFTATHSMPAFSINSLASSTSEGSTSKPLIFFFWTRHSFK